MNDLLLNRWQTRALIIGAIAAVLSIVGAFINHAQFFQSYLFAWLFWLGLSLGALVVVMMQNLTGGWWGLAVRNLCFAAIAGLVGMLWLNGLPKPYHPVFNAPQFKLASQSRFFLCIEARDHVFRADEVRQLLLEHSPISVVEVEK